MVGKCHDPCMLKTTSVDFVTDVGTLKPLHKKANLFSPYPTLCTFPVAMSGYFILKLGRLICSGCCHVTYTLKTAIVVL